MLTKGKFYPSLNYNEFAMVPKIKISASLALWTKTRIYFFPIVLK